MNLNKIGIYVKKNLDGALSTLLGAMTKPETEESRPHREVKLAENVNFGIESERILIEAEAKKSQAIALFRQFQKC